MVNVALESRWLMACSVYSQTETWDAAGNLYPTKEVSCLIKNSEDHWLNDWLNYYPCLALCLEEGNRGCAAEVAAHPTRASRGAVAVAKFAGVDLYRVLNKI